MRNLALLHSLVDESTTTIYWFNGQSKTSHDVVAYLAGYHLSQQGLSLLPDDLTEREAGVEIQKHRKTVIYQIFHFLDVEADLLAVVYNGDHLNATN